MISCILCCLGVVCPGLIYRAAGQFYIAPGDSVAVMPGTLFTLQENLVNNGKIFNGGTLTLNGTALQTLDGAGGWVEKLTAGNHVQLLADLTVKDSLLINNGQRFALGNRLLINEGTVTCAGQITGSPDAGISLQGAGSSSLRFDPSADAVSNALKTLAITNGAVTLQDKLYLYEALLPSAGNITLNDEVVIRSNATATARVGQTGAVFAYGPGGRFVLERYIPGRRAWRLLTAPVTPGSNVRISDAWQDGAPRVTNVLDINSTNNPRPGFGTHITFGLPAVNGYDQGVNGNPSIRYLTPTGWNGVPTATNDGSTLNSGHITDQPGYMLFVRGDRSTPLWQATSAVTTPSVLRPRGRIHTGAVSQPLGSVFVNGGSHFRVVGNAYPSTINFHATVMHPVNQAAGFADAFYLWDPAITGNNGVGGFVGFVYNAAASILAGRPVYDRSVPSALPDNGDIQSGAAWVIDYAGPATSFRMEESHKVAGSNHLLFRPVPQRQLAIQLYAYNTDSSISLQDGALLRFEPTGLPRRVGGALKKMANFAEEIAIRNDQLLYCIASNPLPAPGDTIRLQVARLRMKPYRLQLHFAEGVMPPNTIAWLWDALLQSRNPIPAADTFRYHFAVTADPASSSPDRFRILFSRFNQVLAFSAVIRNDAGRLQWQLEDTIQAAYVVVERSHNGAAYVQMTRLPGSSTAWEDMQLQPGQYTYRLRFVSQTGAELLSEERTLNMPGNDSGWFVFPNPVNSQLIQLVMPVTLRGNASFQLLDATGRQVESGRLPATGLVCRIVLQRIPPAGHYRLQVMTDGILRASVPVAVQPLQ